MGTAASNQSSPRWRILYEEAVLEIDRDKIQLRIAEAERAVMDQIEDLKRSGEEFESHALLNALNVLRDLRKDGKRRTEIGPGAGPQVSCTGLNGGWDFPANGNRVVHYPTVVTGFCSGQDANGSNFSMNVVEFVSVYRDGDGQWIAKVRNGTLNITE